MNWYLPEQELSTHSEKGGNPGRFSAEVTGVPGLKTLLDCGPCRTELKTSEQESFQLKLYIASKYVCLVLELRINAMCEPALLHLSGLSPTFRPLDTEKSVRLHRSRPHILQWASYPPVGLISSTGPPQAAAPLS